MVLGVQMRILFDSKKAAHKAPFGCLVPGQACTLHIHIPCSVRTSAVSAVMENEDGSVFSEFAFVRQEIRGDYDIWRCDFSLERTGLFFYWFRITGHTGTFRLFKYGDDTNMEDGGKWQLSCVPDCPVPEWAKGAIIYQVFPDRFAQTGLCDLRGKILPYILHEHWDEEVIWQPDEQGRVLNNDFYGGNFRGITEKLPYIAGLGSEILYLNPVCMAFSSHRYDTADYMRPDPMLGTQEDFALLCEKAHDLGIRVVLDGVFSHTGSVSRYFDKDGSFGGGAYSNPDSPYRSWYKFYQYPHSYKSWWGFDTLPEINKDDPGFAAHIREVLTYWMGLGADGFRLDVADELPDSFIKMMKDHIRSIRPDALLMGEVWEDASNKIAYGIRRRYFVGGELDSVMNYPSRTAILDFLWGRDGGERLRDTVMTVLENYPRDVALCNMNLLGSHDTPRILTALADEFDGDREALAARRLTPEQLELGKKRLCLAAVLQYVLPGCPSIYYGDEAGMEGGKDPFNRRTYPWGKEDTALVNRFRILGSVRKNSPALRWGDTEFFYAGGGKLGITRRHNEQQIDIYINAGCTPWRLESGEAVAPMDWRMEGK